VAGHGKGGTCSAAADGLAADDAWRHEGITSRPTSTPRSTFLVGLDIAFATALLGVILAIAGEDG
jgi:hypothetical protein